MGFVMMSTLLRRNTADVHELKLDIQILLNPACHLHNGIIDDIAGFLVMADDMIIGNCIGQIKIQRTDCEGCAAVVYVRLVLLDRGGMVSTSWAAVVSCCCEASPHAASCAR